MSSNSQHQGGVGIGGGSGHGHEKKAGHPRGTRAGAGGNLTTIASTNKSPIATPPRAALQGRSKAGGEHTGSHDIVTADNASTKSTKSAKSAVELVTANPSTNTSTNTNESSDSEEGTTTSSTSAAETDKDKRIKDLEKERDKIEQAFSNEFALLSHKLTNSQDTISLLQQKNSSLHQTYLKTDTDLRLLRSDHNSSLSQKEEREREVRTRISSLMLDRDAFREAYNEAMADVKGLGDENRALREQVRGLKDWVSASGKGEEQVTDEVFGEGVVRLGNGLQNWVISNFRRVKIDAEKASDQIKEQLLRLVPTYESLAATSKIHFIQSLVARLLVESVFQVYFVGLPKEQADELEKVESYLGKFGPVENINQWRSTTLSILRKEAPQKLHAETTSIVNSIVNDINNIMTSISDIQLSEARDQSLRALINSSIDLSRLLRVQKAVFTIVMPSIESHQRTMFDPSSMEDIGGEDEETLNEREIRCVTFPGIVKAGDENGERGYLRNVVAKIRVLCAPD